MTIGDTVQDIVPHQVFQFFYFYFFLKREFDDYYNCSFGHGKVWESG